MKTSHKIYFENSKNMDKIPPASIDLVVTSPPYPMIEMWDELFTSQNPRIKIALSNGNGPEAYDLMHEELNSVWKEIYRVLKNGSIACINVGDATRKIGKDFQLFPNHSRILEYFTKLGFQVLPGILWRKPTNAPNKFMGSGMLPPSAYVTLEHENIICFRKGGKRRFISEKEKQRRRESAFFWEERNRWFSDLWANLRGTNQKLSRNTNSLRNRSGAFPLDLALRLILMFSIQEDIVLDPFLGTGTTTIAAMIGGRCSVGFELDSGFKEFIVSKVGEVPKLSEKHVRSRLEGHLNFLQSKIEENSPLKYMSKFYDIPVHTRQEKSIWIPHVKSIKQTDNSTFIAEYSDKTTGRKATLDKEIRKGLDPFMK
ncbi:MAG: DNA-methyltransferase [Candidatus Heimdallarchaeota archaeon]